MFRLPRNAPHSARYQTLTSGFLQRFFHPFLAGNPHWINTDKVETILERTNNSTSNHGGHNFILSGCWATIRWPRETGDGFPYFFLSPSPNTGLGMTADVFRWLLQYRGNESRAAVDNDDVEAGYVVYLINLLLSAFAFRRWRHRARLTGWPPWDPYGPRGAETWKIIFNLS